MKLGTIGHCRRQLVISDEGKTFIHRGSARLGSAMAFSLTIESYWSIESSSVLELRITSRPMNSASFFTPGILDRCGCQLSAQTPFSEETQTPSGVLSTSDWLPSVCPGVDIRATPMPSSTSPSRSTRLSSITWSIPPGTYQAHCIGCGERRVSTSRRWQRNLAFGKNGRRGSGSPSPRRGGPLHRLRGPHQDPQVLHVQVVERDEVDVGGREPAGAERLLDGVVLLGQHVVREPLAVAVDQLRIERGLGGALRHRGFPHQRSQSALEVLELHDHDPV